METRRGPSSRSVLLLLSFLLLRGALSRAADTVAVGRPLSGVQRLVSKRGKFALGFFQPGTSLITTHPPTVDALFIFRLLLFVWVCIGVLEVYE